MVARDGPHHGLDDLTEMRVQSFRNLVDNTTADSMDLANWFLNGPANLNDAKIARLMGVKHRSSQQRMSNDLLPERLAILRLFANGRPGKRLDQSDPKFTQLWSFCGTEQHESKYATHRILSQGKEEKRRHLAAFKHGSDPLPVRRSPFTERDAKVRRDKLLEADLAAELLLVGEPMAV
jgi:hypothetical protein